MCARSRAASPRCQASPRERPSSTPSSSAGSRGATTRSWARGRSDRSSRRQPPHPCARPGARHQPGPVREALPSRRRRLAEAVRLDRPLSPCGRGARLAADARRARARDRLLRSVAHRARVPRVHRRAPEPLLREDDAVGTPSRSAHASVATISLNATPACWMSRQKRSKWRSSPHSGLEKVSREKPDGTADLRVICTAMTFAAVADCGGDDAIGGGGGSAGGGGRYGARESAGARGPPPGPWVTREDKAEQRKCRRTRRNSTRRRGTRRRGDGRLRRQSGRRSGRSSRFRERCQA